MADLDVVTGVVTTGLVEEVYAVPTSHRTATPELSAADADEQAWPWRASESLGERDGGRTDRGCKQQEGRWPDPLSSVRPL
jgi:hypothetical protein